MFVFISFYGFFFPIIDIGSHFLLVVEY
jgi:hypothetical protein